MYGAYRVVTIEWEHLRIIYKSVTMAQGEVAKPLLYRSEFYCVYEKSEVKYVV